MVPVPGVRVILRISPPVRRLRVRRRRRTLKSRYRRRRVCQIKRKRAFLTAKRRGAVETVTFKRVITHHMSWVYDKSSKANSDIVDNGVYVPTKIDLGTDNCMADKSQESLQYFLRKHSTVRILRASIEVDAARAGFPNGDTKVAGLGRMGDELNTVSMKIIFLINRDPMESIAHQTSSSQSPGAWTKDGIQRFAQLEGTKRRYIQAGLGKLRLSGKLFYARYAFLKHCTLTNKAVGTI